MIDRLTLGHDARSPQLCAKPLPVEHVLGTIAFRLCIGGVLRGRFVPRTWFDRVPAGTVLAGTRLFRTRSDYKKWCVPRTCSRLNCTENKCERPDCGGVQTLGCMDEMFHACVKCEKSFGEYIVVIDYNLHLLSGPCSAVNAARRKNVSNLKGNSSLLQA